MFALLKFLRQTRHMRRRARKRASGKKPKRKQKKNVSTSGKDKAGSMELKLHLTEKMLETEVSFRVSVDNKSMNRACFDQEGVCDQAHWVCLCIVSSVAVD